MEIMIGLFAIAVGIGFGLAPIWHILRKESKTSDLMIQEIREIKPLLKDMIASSIDEKIAMLFTYETMVKGWQVTQGNQLEVERKLLLNKMKSDVRALSKLKSMMTPDQKEVANLEIRTVIGELRNHAQIDIAEEIQSILDVLLS